ncbi:GFA family protein [Bowmanella yangjiangensis]|uniref:GFA family protein n=1 Tax=Bowmanella yangjiangensis TaxID=2811230 RepID=A0ABS3CU57_9ALTE|nr:GFA family protein [Bowmanella yangjiangensis]MBN7819956.1 GFA family protein [Bowmanella yangjiangensis]
MLNQQGGCLCGQLRYALNGPLHDAGYCYCRLCQRASGSPTLAWLTVAVDTFSYTKGTPGIFASSPAYQREFCPTCGTPVVFRKQQAAKTVDVTLCSLDNPDSVKPQYHIWTTSQPVWHHIGDNLPQYSDNGPDQ